MQKGLKMQNTNYKMHVILYKFLFSKLMEFLKVFALHRIAATGLQSTGCFYEAHNVLNPQFEQKPLTWQIISSYANIEYSRISALIFTF
jgi:hypothetical protein